jgi:estrogen-related receptor beta like 1
MSEAGAVEEEGGRARPQVNESEALTFNQEIVELLQLLDYETKFCNSELPPMPSMFFVYAAPKDGQQFKYFHQLVAWLLQLCDVQASWKKYDNPNTISTNILVALKEFGVTVDGTSPHKLKNGFGDAVCQILHELTTKVFQHLQAQGKWSWGQPQWPDEALFDEADVDSDAEVGEVEDQFGNQGDDEDDMMYSELAAQGDTKKDDPEHWFVESKVDAREWQLELERVTPQLRVQVANADANEWRSHVEQARKYSKSMSEMLPNCTGQLQALGADLQQILTRVRTKEAYINGQFDSRAGNYRTRNAELEKKTQEYNTLNESHEALLEELRQSTDEYEQLRGEMAERSQTVQDTAPLVKIKDALKRLKSDICQMDLRIGVVNHTLMQAKLRQRPNERSVVKGIDWEEDD